MVRHCPAEINKVLPEKDIIWMAAYVAPRTGTYPLALMGPLQMCKWPMLSHFAPGHLKVAQTQRRWRCTWVLFRSVFFFACYSCNLLLWMQPQTVRQWLLEDFLSVFSNVFLKPGAGSKFKMGFHCSNNKSSPFQHLISALCTIFN